MTPLQAENVTVKDYFIVVFACIASRLSRAQLAMERCAAPQLESARASHPEKVTRTEIEVENGGDTEETTKDAYECRICGYKAIDVKCLSQHLHAAHPVTSFPETSSLRSDRCNTQEEERGGGVDDDDDDNNDDEETACLTVPRSQSTPANNKAATAEGSESASLNTTEDSNETSSSIEAQEQEDRMDISPVPKATQGSSPALMPKHACHRGQTVLGTPTHNQTNLVCLPLVSEGLKLIWVRSEQIHELDAVSDLVEAFNEFPYPTPQEASALARKCELPADRVKAWFMMQRVRYGISWGDDDIRDIRRKLWHIQKRTAGEDCEDLNDEEPEQQDYLGHVRRRPDEMQQVSKQPAVAETHIQQRDHTPKPSHGVSQHTTNDQHRFNVSQNNITSQSGNGVRQFPNTNVVFNNGLEFLTRVPQMNSHLHSGSTNVTPQNTGVQVFNSYGQPPYMVMNDQHTAAQLLPQSFQSLPGKKTKAQLMALRRSFVRKSWPSDAEVQRLLKATGLSCREIRKWFADSRYQLRKNGRAWLAKLAKHNRSMQQDQQLGDESIPGGSFCSSEADNAEEQFDFDVGVDDNEEKGNQLDETVQEISDEGEFEDSKSSIQQQSAERSTSPSPSPSPSFHQARVEPNVRLRKKTREQLEVLRQSFLLCQWPTSDDYLILQQKTGLTKTEIIQWYGDTRYHIKHNQMRWMTSQERQRIIEVITQQQKKSGKTMRSKILIEGMGSGASAFINGSESGAPITWSELFRGNTPVVPEGELLT